MKEPKSIIISYDIDEYLDKVLELLLKALSDNSVNLKGARVKTWADMRSNLRYIEVYAPEGFVAKTAIGVSSVVPVTNEEAERIFREAGDAEEERQED